MSFDFWRLVVINQADEITVATSGAVFVNRKDRKGAVQALEQAGEDMKKRGVSPH